MATYHILTGDALAATFNKSSIGGNVIVIRECLIDGPVSAASPETFWKERGEFIHSNFDADTSEYYTKVKSEFDRINDINHDDEVNLWFENDLFCQVNMWFTISLINGRGLTNVFRVCPLVQSNNKWSGFGNHSSADLVQCYEKHQAFAKGDFKLGTNLWNAYRNEDVIALAFFAGSLSPCFPYLEEVCRAEVERKRNARPRRVLEQLLAKGHTDFNDIFKQFSQIEGIYGYGDLQVNNMLKEIKED